MINPRKNREILRSAMVASALVSVVLGGFACNRGGSEMPASTGSADAKMATENGIRRAMNGRVEKST